MTQTDNTETDIAWMRRLAEEGAQGPMRGASILFAAGMSYGLGALVHWGAVSGRLPLNEAEVGMVWLGATTVFLVSLFVILMRMRSSAGVRTAADRASGTAWMAVGLGIFALMMSLSVIGARQGQDVTLQMLALTPSVIMVFYGLGWAVTATMFRSRGLWGLAYASLIAAPLLAFLTGSAEQYLAYAAALFLLMALPGFLLMRQAGRV